MKIYFLRHAHAGWPHWDGEDDDRPLTEKGEAQSRRVADFLAANAINLDAIFHSPLPRAARTASLIAERFRLPLVEEESLAPGFDAKKLARILASGVHGDVMIVGHESDFSETIGQLTGGRVEMAKAGVACVEVDKSLRGRLLWLVTPKLVELAKT